MPGLQTLPLGLELLYWALEMGKVKRQPDLLNSSQPKHQNGKKGKEEKYHFSADVERMSFRTDL